MFTLRKSPATIEKSASISLDGSISGNDTSLIWFSHDRLFTN